MPVLHKALCLGFSSDPDDCKRKVWWCSCTHSRDEATLGSRCWLSSSSSVGDCFMPWCLFPDFRTLLCGLWGPARGKRCVSGLLMSAGTRSWGCLLAPLRLKVQSQAPVPALPDTPPLLLVGLPAPASCSVNVESSGLKEALPALPVSLRTFP